MPVSYMEVQPATGVSLVCLCLNESQALQHLEHTFATAWKRTSPQQLTGSIETLAGL